MINRRAFLSSTAAGLGAFGGCVNTPDYRPSDVVSILAAGSLNYALERGLREKTNTTVRVEPRGSVAAARLVAAGQKNPDIVSLADTALFKSLLDSVWFVEFATNEIVIAYDPTTEGGEQIADAGSSHWYRPLLDQSTTLGRTDPDLDPLGYRTLFMLELATSHYNTSENLRSAITDREQVYPETQLISQFETGSIDAAIAYRSMAIERDYEYIRLPDSINLGNPAYADSYSATNYTLRNGTTVSGRTISYGTTAMNQEQSVLKVFDTHTEADWLVEYGFGVPENYPRFTDNAPQRVKN